MGKDNNTFNIAVLVSGRGTNLQSIIDATLSGQINANVKMVISNNPSAYALERAYRHGIPTQIIERKNFKSKKIFEEAICKVLADNKIELVCLAGFMCIIGKTLLGTYSNRIINIHPSLLPSFPGVDAQNQAFDFGVKVTGCTVHFIDEKVDHGPIIYQAAVEVKEDDTIESLRERILKEEHRIYPEVIQLIAQKKVKIEGRKVKIL